MDVFNNMITEAELIDAGFKGQNLTWSNNREGKERVRERIDRGLVNKRWKETLSEMTIFHKPAIGSDHCPLVIQMNHEDTRGPKLFRFE